MPDKAGDTFTDKRGDTYELRPDPSDGHLRPVTIKGGKSSVSDIVTVVLFPVVVAGVTLGARYAWKGVKWIWKSIKGRKGKVAGSEKE